METFKILKWHRPISIFPLLKINDSSKRHLLIPPSTSSHISKNNFVSKASYKCNKLAKHIFATEEIDMDRGIIIPGSSANSDLTSTICYIKNKLRQHLIQIQKLGDPEEWSPMNSEW